MLMWASTVKGQRAGHQMHAAGVRPAAVAGLFYAADPARLRQDVESLLISPASFSHRPKALIAPHAGYVYSGAVAGKAFALLRGAGPDVTRVVLIGPAHYVALRGIAISTMGGFETPLGTVEVDRDARRRCRPCSRACAGSGASLLADDSSANSAWCRWSWAKRHPHKWQQRSSASGAVRKPWW